ncbi:MAG: ion channel [Gordonia sp. (in: high G+C Gram-positive bacteria)]|uniref:potassium channel family protein n=1 Tax=Gordonia sp. (in: high G+C Gram-positive bacteria) TaxID=84139 RepID=UPI0039E61654
MTARPDRSEWFNGAVLRPVVATSVLLAAYFLLPIDHQSHWNAIGLIAGGVLLVVFCAGAIRRFRLNVYPSLAAADLLTAIVGLYIAAFSATYYLLSNYHPGSFSDKLTRVDALYYCLTIFTTTGFGDIFAESQGARIAVSAQMVSSLLILGAGVHFAAQLVSDRVRSARAAEAAAPEGSATGDLDD